MTKYDCLIVEDEISLAESTCKYLVFSGINAKAVFSMEECLNFIHNNTTQLILLDINLGDGSGYNLCQIIREQLQIPIIFISSQTSEESILLALNVGGDDYICKPYSLPILLAKVKVVLKRQTKIVEEKEWVCFNDIRVNCEKEIVMDSEHDLVLKRMEKKLLLYLLKNRNRIVTKEELFQNVWNEAFVGEGTLNVHIRKLREKIEKNPSIPQYIITEYGKGYSFNFKED